MPMFLTFCRAETSGPAAALPCLGPFPFPFPGLPLSRRPLVVNSRRQPADPSPHRSKAELGTKPAQREEREGSAARHSRATPAVRTGGTLHSIQTTGTCCDDLLALFSRSWETEK